MSLLICLLTVYPARVGRYYEKFSFLDHALKVLAFNQARGYKGQSDKNPAVPNEILKNTKNCIRIGQSLGKDYVLVLQEDVVFTDNRRMSDAIPRAVAFMDGHPDADMFMFGTNPSSVHSATAFPEIVKFSYATHWQAVLFRVSSLHKFGDLPRNTHADMHFAGMMKDKINCYGLRIPVAGQNPNRPRRIYEYAIFYKYRCMFPYGDPLPLTLIGFLSIVVCFAVFSYFRF